GQYQDSVELSPIVVRPFGAEIYEPEIGALEVSRVLSGEVLAVNKGNNFVVIDLGSDAGLGVGDTLRVFRNNYAFATIEVIQVRAGIAACNINQSIGPIRAKDQVKTVRLL
ncbi:hypothetical protein ACFLZ3_05050, partial [Candidatus Omnitrophota bacterium]